LSTLIFFGSQVIDILNFTLPKQATPYYRLGLFA